MRVIDLETAGNGPDDVCEIGWQDVVQDRDGSWRIDEERGARFVNPGRPISPETMAIHHILDAHVAGAPYWRRVAPQVLRPTGGLIALAAHRATFEQRYCRPGMTGGADWICTWKCAPEGLVHETGLPAHRAMPDAYVTAHHLRDLLNTVPAEVLISWSREPGLLPRVPAGPCRGKAWRDLREDDLRLMAADRDGDVRFSAEQEMRRRAGIGPSQPLVPVEARLI